jgi:hypothetical protein
MGTITRTFANNITTSGVFKPTAFNNASFDNVTAVPSGAVEGGNMVLLSTQTASASASISFTTGIDSTYKEYMFIFNNIHASTQGQFQFQTSTDGGSSYGVTLTSTFFQTEHYESDSSTSLEYNTGRDLAQSTSYQFLNGADLGTNNDDNFCGTMSLFSPSSTTYVKHFIFQGNVNDYSARCTNTYIAGYFNTTSALNAIRFQMSSGNIDAGTIQMFGIL